MPTNNKEEFEKQSTTEEISDKVEIDEEEYKKYGMTKEAYAELKNVCDAIAIYEYEKSTAEDKAAAAKTIVNAYEIGYNNPNDPDKCIFKEYIDEDEKLLNLKNMAEKRIKKKTKAKENTMEK